MKRKIGEIYNKPIIEGDINLKTPNEIHKSELSVGGGNSEVKEYYYLFDVDKVIEAFGMSEEDFNTLLSQSNGGIIQILFYGALNFIGRGINYYREYVIVNQLQQFTSIDILKKIKAIKLYDNINPVESTKGSEFEKDTEHYNVIGNLEERYIKQKNINDFGFPNPALYTTPITKEEYEALIDIPNIIV